MKNVIIIYWTSVVSCSVVIGATTLPVAVIQLFLQFPDFILDLILRGQLKYFSFLLIFYIDRERPYRKEIGRGSSYFSDVKRWQILKKNDPPV